MAASVIEVAVAWDKKPRFFDCRNPDGRKSEVGYGNIENQSIAESRNPKPYGSAWDLQSITITT